MKSEGYDMEIGRGGVSVVLVLYLLYVRTRPRVSACEQNTHTLHALNDKTKTKNETKRLSADRDAHGEGQGHAGERSSRAAEAPGGRGCLPFSRRGGTVRYRRITVDYS